MPKDINKPNKTKKLKKGCLSYTGRAIKSGVFATGTITLLGSAAFGLDYFLNETQYTKDAITYLKKELKPEDSENKTDKSSIATEDSENKTDKSSIATIDTLIRLESYRAKSGLTFDQLENFKILKKEEVESEFSGKKYDFVWYGSSFKRLKWLAIGEGKLATGEGKKVYVLSVVNNKNKDTNLRKIKKFIVENRPPVRTRRRYQNSKHR